MHSPVRFNMQRINHNHMCASRNCFVHTPGAAEVIYDDRFIIEKESVDGARRRGVIAVIF